MKVCFVILYYDTSLVDPAAYLDTVPVYRHLPQTVAAMGHDVRVVHLFPVDAEYREGGVDYVFVSEPRPIRALARTLGRRLSRDAARFEPAVRTLRGVRRFRPDILHVHGIDLHLNLAMLRGVTSGSSARVVLHYHGGYPSRRPAARAAQRFNFGAVDRFLFTTHAHARPFREAGLIRSDAVVTPFMEISSSFQMQDRKTARAQTGMSGRPVFVWSGRLHPVKDPLTALAGFERVLETWPDAALYMFYRTAEMLEDVRSFLRARKGLRRRVQLRGRAPYAAMESIYSSADFFLQASRREFSGCAVLEALSCGAVPVVTDIPSFRSMTDDGRHGILFPAGDADDMAARLRGVELESMPHRSRAARAYFEQTHSYRALGTRLDRVYRDVLEQPPRAA